MSSSQTDPLDPITFMNITRRKSEDSKLSACKTVSYRTALEYSVAVMADSLFEAAAMALRVFSTHGCPTRPAVRLRVQVTGDTARRDAHRHSSEGPRLAQGRGQESERG